MVKRFASSVSIALLALFVSATNALAADGDPTKIGDNVKALVSPNAKAFWWVGLVGGLIFMVFSRKGSRAAGLGVALLVSGIAIYNPGGVGSMMAGIADKIV